VIGGRLDFQKNFPTDETDEVIKDNKMNKSKTSIWQNVVRIDDKHSQQMKQMKLLKETK
jgi:hypothetical protein